MNLKLVQNINDMHSLNIASRISSDEGGSPRVTRLPPKKARLGVTTFSENDGCLSSWRKMISTLWSVNLSPPNVSPPNKALLRAYEPLVSRRKMALLGGRGRLTGHD